MDVDRPASYGDRVAEIYDERLSLPDAVTAATVDFLAHIARDARAPMLELGIGTGRVAIPLVERGFTVDGVDASAKMLEKLREKPGGERIRAWVADFAELPGDDAAYDVIFVVFSTFFALTTQEAQIRAFSRVAAQLRPGGRFVLQAYVPDPMRLANRQNFEVSSIEGESVRINVQRYDPTVQSVAMAHLIIDESGTRFFPFKMRYAYVPELDLMARLAGLRLSERWGSWKREPFEPASTIHISVYERPG